MTPVVYVKEIFKAWRRGEKKIYGAPMRGRCFEKKEQKPSNGVMTSKATPIVKITKMTVIRKDGSREEIKNG